MDEDLSPPARVQAFYARLRTTTAYCFEFAAHAAKDASAFDLLRACLARSGDFVYWKDHRVRWTRTDEATLAQPHVLQNLERLSHMIWTTPFDEEIRLVSSLRSVRLPI